MTPHSKIKMMAIIIFAIAVVIVLWFYTHPLVKSLTIMSSSINEAKSNGTFICSYEVKDAKLLSGQLDVDSFPIVCESFAEFLHHKKNYNSTSIVNSDSLAWVTLIIKNDEDKYNGLVVDEFSGRYPIYRKLYKLPLPDSISIIFECDSLKFSYFFERQ